jgi:hypothetical protein
MGDFKEQIIQLYEALEDKYQKLQSKYEALQEHMLKVDEKEIQLEAKIRKERLLELFKGREMIMYKARKGFIKLPKCDLCNDWRQLCFLSPLGRNMTERCTCDGDKPFYIPETYACFEFAIDTYTQKLLMWYKLIEKTDHFVYGDVHLAKDVYNPSIKYEDIEEYYNMYFNSEEECQKYCDWLNGQEKGV